MSSYSEAGSTTEQFPQCPEVECMHRVLVPRRRVGSVDLARSSIFNFANNFYSYMYLVQYRYMYSYPVGVILITLVINYEYYSNKDPKMCNTCTCRL